MTAGADALSTARLGPPGRGANLHRIGVMTVAHLVNDCYGTPEIAILLPLLAATLGFSLGVAALLVTAYTISSSIIQPFMGHFADRHTTRLISVAGMIAGAAGASMLGVAPSFLVLLVFAIVAGMGTAAYHPQAAAIVLALSGERKTTTMSTYLVGGNLGLALGPLLVARVARWNLHATPLLMLPGIAMAMILFCCTPKDWAESRGAGHMGPSLLSVLWRHRSVLGVLLGVVILRSWTQQGFTTFLPFLYRHQGFGPGHAAAVLAALGVTGAFGGLLGGFFADRFSQRPVVVGALILAGPLLLVLPHLSGPLLYADAAVSGVMLLSSWYVLTVMGQQLLNKNVGMASGLMLGFSIGLGGLGVIPMGLVADHVGILPVLSFLGLLAPLAGLLAIALPSRDAEASAGPGVLE